VYGLQEGHCEERCEIQGDGQEMAVMESWPPPWISQLGYKSFLENSAWLKVAQ